MPPGKGEEWGKERGGEKKMTKREEREEKGRWRERRGGEEKQKNLNVLLQNRHFFFSFALINYLMFYILVNITK